MNTSNSARKDVRKGGRALLSVNFYVGSTDTFDAWERLPEDHNVQHVLGVWAGKSEHAAILTQTFRGVPAILTQAMLIARLTNNDCVLVTFDASGFNNGSKGDALGARKVDVTDEGFEWNLTSARHAGFTIPIDTPRQSAYTFVSEPGAQLIAFTVDQAGAIQPVTNS